MFCDSYFWDLQETWNTTDPDFSPCFQKTCLLWTPCVFLLLLGSIRLALLHSRDSARVISLTWLSITKFILAGAIGVLAVLDIAKSLFEQISLGDVPIVNFVSPLVLLITMIMFVAVLNKERQSGIRTSGLQVIFWLLMTTVNIIILRSQIRVAVLEGKIKDIFRSTTFFAFFPIVLVQLVLSALVDKPPIGAQAPQGEKPCPEGGASFLSRITFWWFSRTLIQGYKRDLTMDDLFDLNEEDKSANVVPRFDKHWHQEFQKWKKKQSLAPDVSANRNELELKTRSQDGQLYTEVKVTSPPKSEPRLFLSMVKTYWFQLLVAAFFKLVYDILQFVSPWILKLVITYTKDKSEYQWHGYLYAALMFVVAFFQSLILHQYFHGCTLIGMGLRTSIISTVYRKMLVLSNAARKTSTVGEIVNLMSVDAQQFMDMMTYINVIWSGPFQIFVSIYLLWVLLGPSILAGLAVMILLIPLNALIANKSKKYQVQQMKFKDKRIKMMNEILNGIRVLKLYAWEPSFEKQVLEIRNKELNLLKRMAYLNSCSTFAWTTAPFIVTLVTFAVYVLSDPNNILDAEKAFVSLSLFNILRFPMSMLPNVISSIVQMVVSLKRLRRFLSNDELDPTAVSHDKNVKPAVIIDNGVFTWEREGAATLRNIRLTVPEGSLVAVVGTVGSGKSSLLSAILGEMDKLAGNVNIKGSIAYVPQQAWIQNTSLKDNILFGKAMDLNKYRAIIDSCALQPDLDIMPAGDQTEIGEKGINLSGGQKQRVSLARAVFQDMDLYLLDDPLSAVDSHVGKHIFDNVVGPKGLLKDKTRILVTHGVSFLPQVDIIVVMMDGQISEIGSYRDLISRAGAFAEFLKNYLAEELKKEESTEIITSISDLSVTEEIMSQLGSVIEPNKAALLQKQVNMLSERIRTISEASKISGNKSAPGTPLATSRHSLHSQPGFHMHEQNTTPPKSPLSEKGTFSSGEATALPNKPKEPEKERLIKAEGMETGRVKMSVFLSYLKSLGILVSIFSVLMFILYNGASIYSNIWLSDWSDDRIINGTVDENQRNMRLGVYGALGIAQGVFIVLGSLGLYLGNVRAGRMLHSFILKNIISSPMVFFDTTPLGRILNRFGKDIDVIDSQIPNNFQSWLACLLRVLTVPIVVGYSTPWFLALAVPLAIFYVVIQRFYVASSRQLKRLESVSKSPIYSHFQESVTGVVTIRAYQQQTHFMKESEARVDNNLYCHFPTVVANRWLAIRLEFVGNIIVFFATLFAVIARDTISPGIVGLSITYALSVTQTLNWMVRMTSELETNIVAVERVKEYSETPTEASWIVPNNRPDSVWPEYGQVTFEDYGTRYREGLDLVIKGINCTINPGEKMGIVGRTGAGKSSLTMALFRIIEPVQGKIIIDGVDISKIGLHDLRSKLTIIPQEPVLFSGTLRMNLDPFDLYTDEQVWRALEHAHLKNFVSGLTEGLQHQCSEGGNNLSVGQRQLICLARALLRKSRVLVLDEATAAVDLETDDLIQETIRQEFKDCTVLTIAHRINTIMDYNRVMVLDSGRIKELDTTDNLLENSDSIFYGMSKDAGLI
ncbi:hypothetical protein ACJMK2_033658 [Sinanodonta woodiana]|uniref:Uncharacterized protein n=1 Tax=Sinanodonta woodiana TaxID=1069815 RepID=A0ABD3WSK9_SINWO